MLLVRFLYIQAGVARRSQGQPPKIFPLLSACSPRTFIITCLLISYFFFFLLTPISFISHVMESCFMVLFPFREATILLRVGLPAIFLSSQPGTLCTSYDVRILSCLPLCPFSLSLHTCAHCAAVLVIGPDSCLDVCETWGAVLGTWQRGRYGAGKRSQFVQ